ncbi:MAG: D-amino acid aminotransferase [Proteobacteria bacterium]|nr:D-amino acid aminotransferase [Pseudomonadota bacterium]MDE3207764.1 D-amino acid aminotransferase [Pseudomonadota bacterium]
MEQGLEAPESGPVFLNGRFMPLNEAHVSVLDRGFVFGDGVYEVIPVYSCHAFRLDEHLRRLEHSLAAIRLVNPYSLEQWRHMIGELILLNPWEDQSIYLQVTRGVARRDHAFPEITNPTVFMMSTCLTTPSQDLVSNGASAITAVDFRWEHCDVKAIALLPNVLLRQAAVDAGANEAILVRKGWLTEGAASNIFLVRDGVIHAPPKDQYMLPGITYDVVLELAHQYRLPLSVAPVPEAWLYMADEIWQTSSTREVLAVTRLNGQPVGAGVPGPVFKRMYALYQSYKDTIMRGKDGLTPDIA